MKNYLAAAVAAALIISTGLVNAYWTGWIGSGIESAILDDFAARLGELPMNIGDWEGKDEDAMDERERVIAGARGAVSRRYTNRQTNQAVSIFLVSGHAREIAQHTPAQCYVAAGFQMMNPEQQYVVETDAGPVECYTTLFKKDEHVGTQYLRVFWTWSYDGTWLAPGLPRVALRGKPALYKLYFITDAVSNHSIEQNPTLDFMRIFMPVANSVLFPARPDTPAEEAPVNETSESPAAS